MRGGKKIKDAASVIQKIINGIEKSNVVFVMEAECCGKKIFLNQVEREIPVPRCDLLNEHVLMDILSCDSECLQKWNEEVIRQGLLFLYQCKIIAFAEITENDADIKGVVTELQWKQDRINFRDDLYKKYIYRVVYPWLCMDHGYEPEMLLYARNKQKHPNYSDEKLWEEIMEYCIQHRSKFELYLNTREVKEKQECWKYGMGCSTLFIESKKELMHLVSNFSEREIQKWLCSFTNFETVLLLLLADDYVRKLILENLPHRLKCLFLGELFTIIKHLELNEFFLLSVINKARYCSYSDELKNIREEEKRQKEKFIVDQSLSLEEKKEYYLSRKQLEIDAMVTWSRFYEPQVLKTKYLLTEFEEESYNKIYYMIQKKEYQAALEAAYQYSIAGKGRVSYILSGLEIDENTNIIFSSYIIRQVDEKKVIYHYKNPVGSYPKLWVEEMKTSEFQEVAEERFFQFCKSVFENKYSC